MTHCRRETSQTNGPSLKKTHLVSLSFTAFALFFALFTDQLHLNETFLIIAHFPLRSCRLPRRWPSTRPVRSQRRTWRCSVRPGSRSFVTWPCCWGRSTTSLKAGEVRFSSVINGFACAFVWVSSKHIRESFGKSGKQKRMHAKYALNGIRSLKNDILCQHFAPEPFKCLNDV